jgi:Bacterial membrane protein YfhO
MSATAARLARHPHLVAIALLAAIVVAWFLPLVWGDQMGQAYTLYDSFPWKPARPPGTPPSANGQGDAATQFWPLLEQARAQVHAGHLPLWNPTVYGGMTLLGDMQTALAYPLTWIAMLLPVKVAWGIMSALKLLTAGVGTYLLGRQLRLGWSGAVVAAVVYMLAAPLQAWLQWPLTTVFSLLPWLLLTTDLLLRAEGRRRRAALAGVAAVVGLAILAGHPESAVLSSTAVAAYLVIMLLADRDLASTWRARAAKAGWWVGGHLLGVALSAVALVPFLLSLQGSLTASAHGDLAGAHLPPVTSVLLAVPNLFGDGLPAYTGPTLYVSDAMYVGVVAALLALVGAIRLRHRPETWALGAMGVLGLMMAFGIPPVSWVMESVPPWSSGATYRSAYIVSLVVAVGAGAGVKTLLARPAALRRVIQVAGLVGASVAVLLAIVAAADRFTSDTGTSTGAIGRFVVVLLLGAGLLFVLGRWRRDVAVALAVLLVALDMAYLRDHNAVLPADQAYPATPAVARFLQSRPGPYRVNVLNKLPPQPQTFLPDTPSLYGVESIQGYDYPVSQRWSDFTHDVIGDSGLTRELAYFTPVPPTGAALAALRLLNARYHVTAPGAPAPNPSFPQVYAGADASVFEDPGALNRAFVVPRAVGAGEAATLAAFRGGLVDPRTTVLVPPAAAKAHPGGVAGPSARSVRVETIAPDHVRLHLAPGAGGWLVFGQSYSPQWVASVDGRDRDTVPADVAVTALPVSATDRVIDLSLDRGPYLAALLCSLLALGGILALWRTGVRRR